MWFGADVPVLPLTVESLRAVSAMLIRGNYRSVENYVSRIKDAHLENYEWTSRLAREQTRASKAAKRGRGPSHQAAELPLEQAYAMLRSERWRAKEVTLGNGQDQDGPPLGFINFVVIGCFFIMREIEISLMLARSVRLDKERKLVHIFLPASKTDPAALTTTRSWGCVCNDDKSLPCPYHAMVDQFELLKERFGDAHGKLPEQLPAFPQFSGEAVAKEWVVVCLEALAALLGFFLVAPDGKRAFGGHTLRVSGARHLAYRGLETRIIMLLARWESEVILRYIKDTPLTRLADLYIADGSASSSSTQQLPVHVISFSEEQIKAAEAMACEAQASVDALTARVEALEKEQLNRGEPELPTFVVSRGGDGCAHKVVPDYLIERPSSWKTYCGWAYGNAQFVRRANVDDLPVERRCEKCISRLSLD